jgi:non-ribosomal peptide synthase protein (TIGR01720 family)
MKADAFAPAPGSCSTVLDVLRWRASEEPERAVYTFLLDGERDEISLSYSELDRRARAIAAQLQSVAAPGERVVLLLPQGPEFPAAFFGCLYAGLVAVASSPPIPGRGASAVEKVVAATGATVALTTTALRSSLEASLSEVPALSDLRCLSIDACADILAEAWRPPSVSSQTLVYLALTSGATATPKAIMCTHHTVMNSLTTYDWELTPASHLVSWMPPHATFQLVVGMLAPVYRGFPATFMSTAAFLERPIRWLQTISRKRATHSLGSNFAFDLCVRTTAASERASLDLSSWEVAMNGGELVRPETLEQFTSAFGPSGFRLEAWRNAYGMSEAMGMMVLGGKGTGPTVRAFRGEALERKQGVLTAPGEPDAHAIVSCGEPLLPEHTAIVDPDTLVRCEPGQVGEIWVGGALNQTLGYWNQPEESQRTFKAYLADTGAGPFLRTGDLGFLYEGELFVVGRVKELIIIRGRNLSPQQIELTVQHSHPALRSGSAAAFTVEADDEERLVVVQEVDPEAEGRSEIAAAIRHAVAERHEIQAYAVLLVPPGSVPKTASGKVQRQPCRAAFLDGRLQAQALERSILSAGDRPALGSAYVPPRTVAERTLAHVWAQVLHMEQVGIHDNFFELGGDSLTSIQAIARARQAGLHFTVEQLVEQQTIAGLATVVGQATAAEAEQGAVTGASPLVPSQQRFFELQDPDEYHIGFYRRIAARQWLDPGLLAEAFMRVIAHHDGLRMRFHQEGMNWRQVNLASEEHHVFSYLDVSWLSREQQDAAINVAGEQLHYTLDLQTGPLVRLTLFDLGRHQPSVVVAVFHHLVFDAVSFRVIIEDLETAYRQLSAGEPVQLPPKTLSLKGWAERLEAYAAASELRDELEHWLAEPRSKAVPLPANPHRKRWGGGQVASLDQEETWTLVHDVPRIYGTEINDALLAALVHAFAEWTGSRSLLVDLVSYGRDPIFPEVDVSRTVGWLATFFPVLLDLGDARGPQEELRTIKEQLRRIPRRGLGYGVLRYLSPDPAVVERLRALPEPQVRFNYAGSFDQAFAESALFSSQTSHSSWVAPHGGGPVAIRSGGEEPELLVTGQIVRGQLELVMFSGRVVGDLSTMEQLMRNYLAALRAILASCVPAGLAGARV